MNWHETPIIPLAVIDKPADAVLLARALQAGGISVMEVALRTPCALEAIVRIAREVPTMRVGAGTILAVDEVAQVKAAGASFGVAPGLNEGVVRKAQALDLPFVPGVMTPTEVERAMALGCLCLKFFPAEAAGGVAFLEALAGPYGPRGVRFIPTGGVNASNMAAYLKLPCVAAVGGSWFLARKLIVNHQWDEITRQTAEALRLAGR